MRTQESKENYLEAILILSNEKGFVRSIDVANFLGFSKQIERIQYNGPGEFVSLIL